MYKLAKYILCRSNSFSFSHRNNFFGPPLSILLSDGIYIANRKYCVAPIPVVCNVLTGSVTNVRAFTSQSKNFRSTKNRANVTKSINVCNSENELLQELKIAKKNRDVESFSKLLKENTVSSVKFSTNFFRELCQLLTPEWINKQNKFTLPRLVYSLGKYGFNCVHKEHLTVYQNMLGKCNAVRKQYSSMEISMIYRGCANANLKWAQLTADQQQADFQILFLMVMISTDGRGLVNNLHSLSKMEVNWNELDSDLQTAIIARLTEMHSDFNEQEKSMVIYSFGQIRFDICKCNDKYIIKLLGDISIITFNTQYDKTNSSFGQQQANTMLGLANMGFTVNNMSATLLGAVNNTLLKNIQFSDSQNLSNTMHSLSRMSFRWADLQSDVKKEIISTTTKLFSEMNSQNLSNTIYAMGVMGVEWASVSSLLQKAFETSFCRLQNSMNEQCVGNILYGLGLMHAEWSSFSVLFHNAVQTALRQLNTSMTEQGIANAVYGMGEMNAHWGSLGSELQNTLFHACEIQSRNFTSQGISNVVYGFGKMRVPWNDSTQVFLSRSIVMNCDCINAQGLSNVLLGLANMGASWDSLSPEVKHTVSKAIERLGDSMNNQNVANSMYALAVLSFDSLSPTCSWLLQTKNALTYLSATREFDDMMNFSQLLVFYETMINIDPSLKTVIMKYAKALKQCEGDVDVDSTRLHAKISQSLQKYFDAMNRQCKVDNEFYGLHSRVFPVDCIVRQGDKIIAFIEIDGAQHYAADGVTLTREDQLKTYLYAQKYPDIPLLRVRNVDVLRMGIRNAATKLAKKIIDCMK